MGRKSKAIMLCLVALFTIGAASAGAAGAAPHWTVEGKAFAGTENLAETVTVEKYGSETSAAFSFTLPYSNKLEARCTGVKLIEAKIGETSKFSASATRLSGCSVVLSPGQEATKCAIRNSGGTNGIVTLGSTSGELVEGAGGRIYLKQMPSGGGPFATIVVTEGTGSCALSGTYELAGVLGLAVGTVTEGKPAKSNVGAEASRAIQEASGSLLRWGSYSSLPSGKLRLSLASGRNWGVSL